VKIRRLIDTGEWTTRRYLSLLGTLLIWGIVAIDAWYLWPTQLGGDTSIVVVSGQSMEPTYFGGDLVIARKMEPSVGDVIVYAPAGLGGSQIVHRIIGGTADEGWQMQGDNNNFIDPFTPQGAEVRGVVLVHYSNFGRVTVLLLNPMVWAFVLLAAMVLMLWYTGDDCDDRDDDDGTKGIGEDAGDPESEAEEEPDLIDRVIEGTEAAVSRMVASGATAGAAVLAALTSRVRTLRPVSLVPIRVSALLGVVGLLALSSVSPASASQLTVNVADQASVMAYSKCATQNLAVTPSGTSAGSLYSQVTVAGIAAACLNKPINVYLHNSAGAIVATFSSTTPASGSTMTLTLTGGATFDASLVTKAVAKVKGWLFVASWSYTWTPPSSTPIPDFSCSAVNPGGNVPHGKSCSVTNGAVTKWNGGAGNAYQYKKVTFTVNSEMDDFLVTFDFGDSATYGPWPAGAPTRVWSQGNVVKATLPSAYSCSLLPTVSLNRVPNGDVSINNFEILVSNDPSAAPAAGYTQVVCP